MAVVNVPKRTIISFIFAMIAEDALAEFKFALNTQAVCVHMHVSTSFLIESPALWYVFICII